MRIAESQFHLSRPKKLSRRRPWPRRLHQLLPRLRWLLCRPHRWLCLPACRTALLCPCPSRNRRQQVGGNKTGSGVRLLQLDSLLSSCRRDSQCTEWFRRQQRPGGHRRSGGWLVQQEAQLWPRSVCHLCIVHTFISSCCWQECYKWWGWQNTSFGFHCESVRFSSLTSPQRVWTWTPASSWTPVTSPSSPADPASPETCCLTSLKGPLSSFHGSPSVDVHLAHFFRLQVWGEKENLNEHSDSVKMLVFFYIGKWLVETELSVFLQKSCQTCFKILV